MTGLEPTHLSVLDPKSSAATNYATSAIASTKVVLYFYIPKLLVFFFKKIDFLLKNINVSGNSLLNCSKAHLLTTNKIFGHYDFENI